MFDEERGVDRPGRRSKRFLTPQGKYEIWLQLVHQELTLGEAADRYQVDRLGFPSDRGGFLMPPGRRLSHSRSVTSFHRSCGVADHCKP